MNEAGNYAAVQIDRAQSICIDLTAQIAELTTALTRQQDLIDALLPSAKWNDLTPPVEDIPTPEVDTE